MIDRVWEEAGGDEILVAGFYCDSVVNLDISKARQPVLEVREVRGRVLRVRLVATRNLDNHPDYRVLSQNIVLR